MEERISKLIGSEGITPTKFADIIGVQRSAISHIITGRNKPSFDLIQKILSKFPLVNAEWLIMGRGELYKTKTQNDLFDKVTDVNNEKLQDTFQKDKKELEQKINNDDKHLQNSIIGIEVERIVIFYNDRSFKVYTPS